MSDPLKKTEKVIKQEEGDEKSNLNANTSDKLVNLHSPWQIKTIGIGAAREVEEPWSSFEAKMQKLNLHIYESFRSSSVFSGQMGLQFTCAPLD